MQRWSGVASILGFLFLNACSDSGGNQGPTPTQKCEAFADVWCGKAIGCLVELGTIPEAQRQGNVTACHDAASMAARCASAVAVGPTYDQCVSETNAMACSSWNVPLSEIGSVRPPASCSGVIKVSP
jgi:hypothetical protein